MEATTSPIGQPANTNILATDGTANQIGHVTHEGNGMYRVFHEYDALGRSTKSQHVMDDWSHIYSEAYGYPQGSVSGPGSKLMAATFPDLETVSYTYDAGGAAQSVTSTPSGGSAQPIVKKVLRNVRGQTTEVDYGNNAQQYHCYNDNVACDGATNNTDFHLREIITALNGKPQQYTYAMDAMGNVTSVSDANGDVSANYGYDSLDQLTSWTGGTFGYDAAGNLTFKEGVNQGYYPGTHRLQQWRRGRVRLLAEAGPAALARRTIGVNMALRGRVAHAAVERLRRLAVALIAQPTGAAIGVDLTLGRAADVGKCAVAFGADLALGARWAVGVGLTRGRLRTWVRPLAHVLDTRLVRRAVRVARALHRRGGWRRPLVTGQRPLSLALGGSPLATPMEQDDPREERKRHQSWEMTSQVHGVPPCWTCRRHVGPFSKARASLVIRETSGVSLAGLRHVQADSSVGRDPVVAT
jgi:YD repeat-containing protein